MATSSFDLPAEMLTTIVNQLCEDDEEYMDCLKNLSLTNKQFAAIIRPRLFKVLHLQFRPLKGEFRHLLDILSSDVSIKQVISEIHFVNLFDDLLTLERGMTWVDVPAHSKQQVEREIDTVSLIFRALDTHQCIHITLKNQMHKHGPPNHLIPMLTAGAFVSLTRLTIHKGPKISITVIGQIRTLECLELFAVRVDDDILLYNPPTCDGVQGPLPILRRLVVIDAEWAYTAPIPFGLRGFAKVFDLRRLESLALQVGLQDDEYYDEYLKKLDSICGNTVKELSLHIRRSQFSMLCHRWDSLREFTAIQRLYLYFPNGVERGYTPERGFDPYLAEMDGFHPPPSLEHLSFGLKWSSSNSMGINLSAWTLDQIKAMDRIIDKYFDSRWMSLKEIDFQLLFDKKDRGNWETPDWFTLEENKAAGENMVRRGVVVSTLPNKLINTSEWPYYSYAPTTDRI